jgi:hypothetical protein
MQKTKTARMLVASILTAIVCTTSYAAGVKSSAPEKTTAKPAVQKDKAPPPAVARIATASRDEQKRAEPAPITGNYEAAGSLLTILSYPQGQPNEHLVSYAPDTSKSLSHCSFFAAPIIPAGTTTFNAHRYATTGLPTGASNCMMRIRADGAKAEILSMTPECSQICSDPQTLSNPGVLKRVLEK